MGGSLMQLVAVGAQDVPIIGNPQMTHFKSVFKRHTHFALEAVRLNFNEAPNFGKKVTCLIDKKGDLLTDMMIEVKLPALPYSVSWINAIGYNMINKVELEIGGVVVDTIHGRFMDIYSELSQSESHRNGNYKMIGKFNVFTRYSQHDSQITVYIRLPFWFTDSYGLSLPLVALQYHDVVLNVHFNEFSKLWYAGTEMSPIPSKLDIVNAQVYCDYIYLDTHERRNFAKRKHTYLIKQHQICDKNPVIQNNTITKAELNFNLPTKEILWVYQADRVSETNDWSNYSYTLDNDLRPAKKQEPITAVELQLNGQHKFEKREGSYFRLVQPLRHHTRVSTDFIYCYSFALYPEKPQPSGHLDFSFINSTVLTLHHPDDILQGNISVFAINYNYLQIMNGMAGLVYQS